MLQFLKPFLPLVASAISILPGSGQDSLSVQFGIDLAHGPTFMGTTGELRPKVGNFLSLGITGEVPVATHVGLMLNINRTSRQLLTHYDNGEWRDYIFYEYPLKGTLDYINSFEVGLGARLYDVMFDNSSVSFGIGYNWSNNSNSGGAYTGTYNDGNIGRIFYRTRDYSRNFLEFSLGVGYKFLAKNGRGFYLGVETVWTPTRLYEGEVLLMDDDEKVPKDTSLNQYESLKLWIVENFEKFGDRADRYWISRWGIQLRFQYLMSASKPFKRGSFTPNEDHRHLFFAELLGSGMFYSLNYEYLLGSKEGRVLDQYISTRAGISWLPRSNRGYLATHVVSLPVSVNYGVGIGGVYLHAGGYFTPLLLVEPTIDPAAPTRSGFLYMLGGIVGLRYMPKRSPMFFQAAYTPHRLYFKRIGPFASYTNWPWVGVGIGFRL